MSLTKNIKRCLWWWFCCCLLLPAAVSAQQTSGQETILIISSYNPDTRRMSSFITDFERHIVASGVPCEIIVETLECRGIADAPMWIAQTESIIHRYESRGLRALILLGQEAWASFVSLGYYPDQVMVFGCFASENGVRLPPADPNDRGWMPVSENFIQVIDSLGQAGGVLNQYDVKRNVELIESLYPNVETIGFVSDNTYGGVSLQALVREQMAQFPHLKLELIDSRAGDSAARAAYAALPARSAVLLGTWHVGSDGEYLMQRSLTDLVQANPTIPVFSITRTGLGDVALGGYVPVYEIGAESIADQIIEYYKKGTPAHVHFEFSDGVYQFDSRKLRELKIPEYSLPAGSIVEDSMAVKLTKYSHYINLLAGALGLLLLLLGFVVWQFLRMRKLTLRLEEREEQLVVAREKAEESDMLKSAFLANMSHEIRTPLNAIMGFSSLMQTSDLTPEERSEYCSIVVSNSEMLLTLLNDILDISSLECGKIKFSYNAEDVVQICQHVILTTAHTRQSGVECRFETPVDSFTLVTDGHRLSQILINLLTNAGKFTAKGSITLAFHIQPDQNAVIFSVTDTGPGIPIDKQEMVFTRFEKLDGNKKKGTGLGLAICRQIAMIFGGDIWVDPCYTDGARFIFTHPLDRKCGGGENPEGGG